MIKCAVIGLGRIGMLYDSDKYPNQIWSHTKAISKSKDVKLHCVIDSIQKKLNIYKKRFKKSSALRSISDLTNNNKIDLCIVSTPARDHYNSIKKLLEKTKPKMIICEKPIEYSIQKSIKILNLCKKNKIKLLVNFIRRCDPSALKIKKIINNKQKKIKNFYAHGTIRYSKGLLENGSHFIDLAIYWFGKIKKIEKMKKQKGFDYDFVLFFEKAKITFLSCNITNFQNFSIELFLNDSRLRYDHSGNEIFINKIYKHENLQTRNLIMDFKKNMIKSDFLVYQKNVMNEVKKIYYNKKSDQICSGKEALYVLKIVKKISHE